jgi:hypothetical protein
MENLPATKEQNEIVSVSKTSIFLNMQRFADAQRVAGMLAASTLVPEQFRSNIGNCVIALNLAERLNIDPFMMMQSMYVVHGRPGIAGQLAIALVEGTGRFTPLKYKFSGSGKTAKNVDRPETCIAYATEIKTGEIIEGPMVTWEMASAEGWLKDKGTATSKWQTLPELMFRYRSAMFWARTNCPGALLGLKSTEELEDIGSITLMQTGSGRYEAPQPEVPVIGEDTVALIKAFDDSIPEDVDKEILAVFLSRTAEGNKSTVDQVKIECQKDAVTFWKVVRAFEKQEKAKRAKNGNGKKKEEVSEMMAPAPCPENPETTYTKDHCDKCGSREVCKIW